MQVCNFREIVEHHLAGTLASEEGVIHEYLVRFAGGRSGLSDLANDC